MFGSGRNNDSDSNGSNAIDRSTDDNGAWDDLASQIQDAREWSQSAFDRFNGFVNSSLSNGAQVEEQANRVLNSLGLPRGVLGAIGSKDIAYPVPSVKQYASCLDRNGESVWTEDGLWRCLYKGSAAERGLGPDVKQFKDYTGFLTYQRSLLKKQRDDRAKAQANIQIQLADEDRSLANSQWLQSDDNKGLPQFPGSKQPRLISLDEAKSKNLKPLSTEVRFETVTLDDGSIETRRQEVNRYDDNTATIQSSRSTVPESSKPSGWFWK